MISISCIVLKSVHFENTCVSIAKQKVHIKKEMIGGHLDKCPDLMVHCPNIECEVRIKRKDMASHHLECPYETISCPYKDVRCTYTSPRHTMADHKATSCGHHLDLAMVQLKKQDEKFKEMCCTPPVI